MEEEASARLWYRGLETHSCAEDDFRSYAKLRGKPGRPLEGDRLISWYGVSIYDSIEALEASHPCPFVAELDLTEDEGVLVLKTTRNPRHYDLVGDRRDMISRVTRVLHR